MPRVWPRRIYLKNETSSPHTQEVYDAETGKPLYGVVDVSIHMTSKDMDIKVTGATTEPFTAAANERPDSNKGEYDYQGVVVEDHHYYVRRIEAEGEG